MRVLAIVSSKVPAPLTDIQRELNTPAEYGYTLLTVATKEVIARSFADRDEKLKAFFAETAADNDDLDLVYNFQDIT